MCLWHLHWQWQHFDGCDAPAEPDPESIWMENKEWSGLECTVQGSGVDWSSESRQQWRQWQWLWCEISMPLPWGCFVGAGSDVVIVVILPEGMVSNALLIRSNLSGISPPKTISIIRVNWLTANSVNLIKKLFFRLVQASGVSFHNSLLG